MKRYGCRHCGFGMNARKRPERCPACLKVSHEDDNRPRSPLSGVIAKIKTRLGFRT